MSFTTIVSEGNLIPADLLAQIAAGEAEGQESTKKSGGADMNGCRHEC